MKDEPLGFAETISERLSTEVRSLALRWLERLNDLLGVDATDIFPTDDLLDHIPQLIHEISRYVLSPGTEEVASNSAVVTKARELGMLRHAQHASVHQLLREYHLLGAILETFLEEETERFGVVASPRDVAIVAARISKALRTLEQTTIDTFIAEYTDRLNEQQDRIESFNRMVSHELRQPLGTLEFAVRTLQTSVGDDPSQRQKLLSAVDRSVQRLIALIKQLEHVARLHHENKAAPGRQEVDVASVAREVSRQLRDMADHHGVEIRTAENLPVIVTDTARLELVFMNLMANAIKYSDPAKPKRFVEVFLSGASDDGRTVCIRDNGIGVSKDNVPFIFKDFYRARPDMDATLGISGTGLGLAIVADCVKALGGRISVASVEGEGTAFDLWLPEAMPSSPENRAAR
jgi:signal transduction histidine kinase